MTFRSGATSCECIDGYDRARDETHADGCTRRPTRPRDLRLTSNQTSIQLDWSRPANNGGRNDKGGGRNDRGGGGKLFI